MSDTKGGGPAYPTTLWHTDSSGVRIGEPHDGLSLRDYFAGHALGEVLRNTASNMSAVAKASGMTLEGILSDEAGFNEIRSAVDQQLAERCYQIADAMIAERNRRTERAK